MDIRQLAIRWLDGLNSPDSEAFSRLYAEGGVWVDPQFGAARRGRELVGDMHRKWHASVLGFDARIERILVDGNSATLTYTCAGTFSGEPLGTGPTQLKPTMATFTDARAACVIDFDDHGLVVLNTEYYDREIMPGGKKPSYSEQPPPPPA